jgi:putative membrane protein
MGSCVFHRSVRTITTVLLATPGWAHTGEALQPHDLATAWSFDPIVLLGLIFSAWAYARGSRWAKGIRRWEAASYWTGWVALLIALVSPLHGLGEVLFSAHMAQHEVLMVVAAPLLILGRPGIPYLWSLPPRIRSAVAQAVTHSAYTRILRQLSKSVNAWALHFATLWIWHLPLLFDLSVRSDFVHALQHFSFLGSALLFWWSLFGKPRSNLHYGVGTFYVFTTMVHTGVLGALLTFTTTSWYAVYEGTTAAWGLTPLEDQQLGGLIMTVPPLIIYLTVFLSLFALWIGGPSRSRLQEDRSKEVQQPRL